MLPIHQFGCGISHSYFDIWSTLWATGMMFFATRIIMPACYLRESVRVRSIYYSEITSTATWIYDDKIFEEMHIYEHLLLRSEFGTTTLFALYTIAKDYVYEEGLFWWGTSAKIYSYPLKWRSLHKIYRTCKSHGFSWQTLCAAFVYIL